MEKEQAEELLVKKIGEETKKNDEEMAKKAKFKIQLWFKSDRHLTGVVAYTLSFWESGKRLHGGGDEMMFICRRHEGAPLVAPFDVARSPAKNMTSRGCGKLIPGELAQLGDVIVCPHCGTRHRTDQIGDSVFYRTTMDKAADVLASWWRKLDCDADIYVKYSPKDPRTLLMASATDIATARRMKGLTVYPLARIIKDTLAGATVESRFKALLTA
jgi:hypothetical protein